MNQRTLDEQTLKDWPIEKLRYVHLEMGLQCNVRCAMCYQTDFSPKSRLPETVWRDRLLPTYRTADRLIISGGEPTVIPGCRQLLEMVTRDFSNLTLDTVTNGLLFRGLWVDAFLAQGHCLNFSINAANPKLYERIVQFGNYELATGNVDYMVRRKMETGSKVIVRISTVMTDDTAMHLPEFVQWGADHGVDEVLVFTDHVGQIRRFPPSKVRESIAEAYEIEDANPQLRLVLLGEFDWHFSMLHGLSPVRPRPQAETPNGPCPTAFDTLFVETDGAAKPCCKSWYMFGNLVHQSLMEVWNGKAAYRFRRRMLDLDFRDCLVACELNANPIDHRIASARKAYWAFRRDPGSAFAKGLRWLGLTSAQRRRAATLGEDAAGKDEP
ncbi:MAG: SPASM domain-containing protein [bacterium]|nr:SPASM domain-containing protein [bacterium]